MSAEADHGPATPAGGEPTADDINTLAHLNSRMLVGDGGSVTIKTADAWRYRQALGRFLADNAKDARVADLEGMLAVVRDDLRDQLKDAYVAGCVAVLEWAMPDAPTDDLDEGGYDYAAQAITQLDKEAGGK